MNTEMVDQARQFAFEQLAGQVRGNGRPFMEHVDAVASIVAKEIGLTQESGITGADQP
jgi:(p)ppGpp synthase/HD superfamily hydrolase